MYSVLLVIHFLGLALGAGTSFYMAALSMHAAKTGDHVKAREIMQGPGAIIAEVGLIGLVLMLVSGVAMTFLIGDVRPLGWAFGAKMALVAAIIALIITNKRLARRAQQAGTPQTAERLRRLMPLGPGLATLTIVFAVLAFH